MFRFFIMFFLLFISNYTLSKTISAGSNHTALLTYDGQVYTFGDGYNGQLGHGDRRNRYFPTLLTGLQHKITAVAAGGFHTALLTDGGQVYTFGTGYIGQVGHTTHTDATLTPTLIEGISDVAAIATGISYTVLLTNAGQVYTFGLNDSGELGHGDNEVRNTPTLIQGIDGITAVAAGNWHTLLLTAEGQVYSFGSNDYGQLGRKDNESKSIPKLISGLNDRITAIAAGARHTVLLTAEGEVYTFGEGRLGQLGHGDNKNKSVPTLLSGLQEQITAVSAGAFYTVLLSEDGQVYTFGEGKNGQLGHGNLVNIKVPTLLAGLQNRITAITAGGSHTALLTDDGQVYTFGAGRNGELGLGDESARFSPTLLRDIEPIMQPITKKKIKSAHSVLAREK